MTRRKPSRDQLAESEGKIIFADMVIGAILKDRAQERASGRECAHDLVVFGPGDHWGQDSICTDCGADVPMSGKEYGVLLAGVRLAALKGDQG